jgi:hypothetical protein
MRLTFWEATLSDGWEPMRSIRRADLLRDVESFVAWRKGSVEIRGIARRTVTYRDALALYEDSQRAESDLESLRRDSFARHIKIRNGVDAARSLLEARAIVNGITAD